MIGIVANRISHCHFRLGTTGLSVRVMVMCVATIMIAAPACNTSSRVRSEPSAHQAGTENPDSDKARETSNGSFFVTYAPKPDPIPLNQLFELVIRVFSGTERSKPLTDVSIEVDAAMPAHHHGMNLVPRVTAAADGSFLVQGMLFHMPGDWELYIDVRSGDKKERARFDVVMK